MWLCPLKVWGRPSFIVGRPNFPTHKVKENIFVFCRLHNQLTQSRTVKCSRNVMRRNENKFRKGVNIINWVEINSLGLVLCSLCPQRLIIQNVILLCRLHRKFVFQNINELFPALLSLFEKLQPLTNFSTSIVRSFKHVCVSLSESAYSSKKLLTINHCYNTNSSFPWYLKLSGNEFVVVGITGSKIL